MIYFPTSQLSLQQDPKGIVVSQDHKAYLARKWELTESVVLVVDLATSYGLSCMIQNGHPQRHRLLFDQGEQLNGEGTVYLSFSRAPEEPWVFVLDDNSSRANSLRQTTFNRQHSDLLIKAISGAKYENRNKARKHVQVPIENLEAALKLVLK